MLVGYFRCGILEISNLVCFSGQPGPQSGPRKSRQSLRWSVPHPPRLCPTYHKRRCNSRHNRVRECVTILIRARGGTASYHPPSHPFCTRRRSAAWDRRILPGVACAAAPAIGSSIWRPVELGAHSVWGHPLSRIAGRQRDPHRVRDAARPRRQSCPYRLL